MGLHDEARAALEESVARGHQAGDEGAAALPIRNLAIIASRRGDYDGARRLLEDSLRGLRDLGEKWFVSRSIETLAEVLAWQGEHQHAAVLFGRAEGLRDAVGASVLAFFAATTTRPSPERGRHWEHGRSMNTGARAARSCLRQRLSTRSANRSNERGRDWSSASRVRRADRHGTHRPAVGPDSEFQQVLSALRLPGRWGAPINWRGKEPHALSRSPLSGPSQCPARGSRNAAISSPLRTSRTFSASTGWFQVLPSIALNRATSAN
jgi:Tetratricopeptide repeat